MLNYSLFLPDGSTSPPHKLVWKIFSSDFWGLRLQTLPWQDFAWQVLITCHILHLSFGSHEFGAVLELRTSKNLCWEVLLVLIAVGTSQLVLKKGQVAQSVEQRTENPCVGGSIPPLATI